MNTIKKNLLLILLLIFFIPTISFGAQTYTLKIAFSFAPPDNSAKILAGYRLYKGGSKVCETSNPNSTNLTCKVSSAAGTYKFSLAAYYSNKTESPRSAAFPVTLGPTTVSASSSAKAPTAVLTSSTAVGKAPLTVKFNGSASTSKNSTIKKYLWVFGDGSKATGKTVSHVFKKVGTYTTKLTVTDSKGLSSKVTTPIVVASTTSSSSADSNTGSTGSTTQSDDSSTGSAGTQLAASKIEVGEVKINHAWVKVLFKKTFSQPIVIASTPITNNGGAPVTTRIRNINKKGFEIRLQEWDYLDGTHAKEDVDYIVMEKGTYTLGNGTKIEAGSFTGTKSFKEFSLQQKYNVAPVVLTQVATVNDASAVTGRVRKVDQNSFAYVLQEQERTKTSHRNETVDYIAWQPGTGIFSGLQYEAKIASPGVTMNWANIKFQSKFSSMPFFIAGMQSCNGADPAAVRARNLSKTAIAVEIQEEQSKDKEVTHVKENVGYFVIGAAN